MTVKRRTVSTKREEQTRMLKAVGRYVRKLFGASETRIEALEERAANIERRAIALEHRLESERKGFFYRGVWTEGEAYTEGDFATDHGSLWHCNAPTADRPGTSNAWQLAVKAGRPGRDARDRR